MDLSRTSGLNYLLTIKNNIEYGTKFWLQKINYIETKDPISRDTY